jgi:hypothetical protein
MGQAPSGPAERQNEHQDADSPMDAQNSKAGRAIIELRCDQTQWDVHENERGNGPVKDDCGACVARSLHLLSPEE